MNNINRVLEPVIRLGARRTPSHRQNLMMATLLVPLGATVMLAATKVLLRHSHANVPMLVAAVPPVSVLVANTASHALAAVRVALEPVIRVTPPSLPDVNEAMAPARPGVVRSVALDEAGLARAVNEARLRRDPADIEARSLLIAAALSAGQIERAHTMALQALHESPNEPKAWIVSARLAKAEGNAELARHELGRARDLRMQQLGYSDNGDDDSTLPEVTLAPGGEAYRGKATSNQQRWTPPSSQFAQADIDLAEPASLYPAVPFGSPTPLAPLRRPIGARLDTRPTDLTPPVARTDAGDPGLGAPIRRAVAATASVDMDASGQSNSASTAGNPFRVAQIGGLSSGDSLAPAVGSGVTDPMTQQIDREIAALDGQINPAVQAGFGFRVRSGSVGLSQLTELTSPLEGEFSPGDYGRMKVSVTPTFLMGGKLGAGIANQQQFGTGAFGNAPVGNQTAQGTALNVGYAFQDLSADVGSTPLGFPITNVVGGVQWAPKLSDNIGLRIIGERRAITDSVLSFAGARDPSTGNIWGGVTRTRGRINLEANAGQTNFYAGAGGGVLTGTHVQRNSEIEAGAGVSTPVYKTDTQEVRIGLDLSYLSYNKNLGSFTLGQGGYFSPQQFFAAVVPVTYREKVSEDLNYEVGGSVGIQNVRSKSSLYYPMNPDLQANLVAQLSNPGSALFGGSAIHGPYHDTGIAGGAHALIDYRILPSLHIGGKVAVEHVGDYTEGSGLLYARYVFNQSGRAQ